MRVGIQLPEVEREVRWPEFLDMARAAEECGFASVWVPDHLLYRADKRGERGPWEAWTLLAALSAATERVGIGSLVACTAFHPPGLVAKMAATIAEVSEGRFVLGLGAGWNEGEFRAFGLPFDHRVSRFEESFTIVRTLLAGQRASLAGRFFDADDAVLLPAPTHRVPVMIGSNGPRMLGSTLPHVDAWCRNFGTVSIVGVYGGFLDKIPMGSAINRGLTFRMAQTPVQHYLPKLLERIQNGDIDPSFVITHTAPLEKGPELYKTFRDKKDGCIKVVLKPGIKEPAHV